jgi:hypothetical protein
MHFIEAGYKSPDLRAAALAFLMGETRSSLANTCSAQRAAAPRQSKQPECNA